VWLPKPNAQHCLYVIPSLAMHTIFNICVTKTHFTKLYIVQYIFRAVEHRLVFHGTSTVALYRIYHSISSEEMWIQKISISLQ